MRIDSMHSNNGCDTKEKSAIRLPVSLELPESLSLLIVDINYICSFVESSACFWTTNITCCIVPTCGSVRGFVWSAIGSAVRSIRTNEASNGFAMVLVTNCNNVSITITATKYQACSGRLIFHCNFQILSWITSITRLDNTTGIDAI